MIQVNLSSIVPESIIACTALLVLILELLLRPEGRGALRWVALLGIVGAFLAIDDAFGTRTTGFFGMVSVEDFSSFLQAVILLGAGFTLLISSRAALMGGYCLLLLLSLMGMMILVKASDLIMIFLGIETLSIPLYILAGIMKTRARSLEAAFKYFVLGAFSSAFLLFGIALLYSILGTTNLFQISRHLNMRPELIQNPIFLASMGLMLIGFGFKVAAVPFHMWVPDVYEGAPTPVTAFMSVGVKAAAFAALARMMFFALGRAEVEWSSVLWGLAVATMVLGNLIALAQENIKRMLAYSSIAHAGYLLVALTSGTDIGLMSILFYLFIYTLTNVGAFGTVLLLERLEGGDNDSSLSLTGRGQGGANNPLSLTGRGQGEGEGGGEGLLISDYAGLGWRHPLIALAMAVFLFSLTGVPPTAGFVGKFYIFSAAVKADYIGLAVIGVLMSAVSAYYYLRVVYVMYMQEPSAQPIKLHSIVGVHVVLAIAVYGILRFGVLPGGLLALAYRSARSILF